MTQAYTNRFTEVHEALVGTYLPPASKWQQHFTSYVNMANHQRAIFILEAGVLGGTVDFRLVQATDATGANVKDITGKAITQISLANGDSNTLHCIELRTEEMDINNGFTYVAAMAWMRIAPSIVSVLSLFGASNLVPVPTTAWSQIID